MYTYGRTSRSHLKKADEGLVEVFEEALALGLIDITIIESHRGKAKQNRLFNIGKSKLKYPKSKHNKKPSEALDAAPYVNGKASDDWRHCCYLAGIILAIGNMKGIKIRWGGNWDKDGEPITDQTFQDLWHYERIE